MEWYYDLVKCSEVETYSSKINLQDLPEVVIEKIFSYLSYNQIAENRLVSRLFNQVGSEMLNRGFCMVEKYHRKSLKAFKSKLPRRESERKVHPLSRQCDILVAIETRLSMLTMTFIRYIDAGQCCFIPGKVLDELLRVLRYVNYCSSPPHDLLQELRDITSMAMEHFDEKIVPNLKEKLSDYRSNSRSSLQFVDYIGSNNSSHDTVATPRITTYKSLFNAVRQNLIRAKSNHNLITSISHKSKKIVKHTRYTAKQIKLMKNKMNEQSKEIQKLRRCIQSWEAKFRDLSAEVRGISRRNKISSLPLPDESTDKDNKVEKVVTRSTRKRKL